MMSTPRLLVAAAVIAATCIAEPAHAQTTGLGAADMKAIGAVSDAFGHALTAKDWKAASALYTADGTLYPPGESAVKGRSSIEACLTAFPPVTAFSLRATKTDGSDDVAYVQGTFSMTLAPKGGAAPEQASGYFLQVLRRQANGSWQIAVQMLSLH
jgi:uncharacterized protein (TIGR02246 family)